MEEKKEKRPVVHRTGKDGEAVGTKKRKNGKTVIKHKTYPNGIQVTFGALWQYWWEFGDKVSDRDSDALETSAEEFGEIFDLVGKAKLLQKKYPDIVPPGTPKAAGEAFQEVGNGTRVSLDYFTIRWAAELLDVPVGLFILFTHLVSRERRLINRVANGELTHSDKLLGLINLVEQIEAFAETARKIIASSGESNSVFFEEFPPESIRQPKKNPLRANEAAYLAKVSTLKVLVDAVRDKKKQI